MNRHPSEGVVHASVHLLVYEPVIFLSLHGECL